jgi:hypothetical protein
MTRAYGTKPIILKLCYLAVFALVVAWYYSNPNLELDRARPGWALLSVAVISLILINAQGVTALTSERDTGALDLLLVTDLTPPEFIYGKLYGVLYNAKEMILLPIALAIWFGMQGIIRPEEVFYGVIDFGLFCHFAAMLGLHAAITYTNSRTAVANSLGTIFFLMIGIGICALLITISDQEFGRQLLSFMIFIGAGSVALFGSLGARNPSQAIALVAILTPFWSFYCVISLVRGDFLEAFVFSVGVYGFALLSMLIPAVSDFGHRPRAHQRDSGLRPSHSPGFPYRGRWWTATVQVGAIDLMRIIASLMLAVCAWPVNRSIAQDQVQDLPRIPAIEPRDAMGSFRIKPGFALRLAACEPDVVDPVAATFDADGRLYVIEMRGYPFPEARPIGRVRLLEDLDGDGSYERSTIFLDGLRWPTAILAARGGVFVVAAPDVIHAVDRDGDGVADSREVVLTGLGTGNVQALANGLLWSPDGWIYCASGGNGGMLRAPRPPGVAGSEPRQPRLPVPARRISLRGDPRWRSVWPLVRRLGTPARLLE